MDCSNPCPETDPRRAFKNPFGEVDKSVQFWGEARGESRKISVARLRCAPHSDLAESMAMAIWERMTPEHYRLVSEIERMLAAHDEIRVAVLRETLGQIFESLNVDVKELRAIHPVPIEALTLLLNHIIKIYNMSDADIQTTEELVPLSERIKEQASRAEKHGFGSIKVSKNMYASERAKLAMLQTQLLGRLKLKSGTGAKFQNEWRKLKYKLESCKKDESKRKLRQVLEIKRKLKEAQETLGSSKNGITLKTGKVTRCRSKLSKSESQLTSSSNQSFSTVNQDTSIENVVGGGSKTNDENAVVSKTASIDTSSWVISPTHEYYFGCTPPVIPKTTVTHEVYPKPEETKMEPWEDIKKDVPGDGWDLEAYKSVDLEPSKSALESESGMTPRYTSTTSSSYTNVDDQEAAMHDESHGDASTIFAWTEPEKSASYCLNTGDKTVDSALDESATEGNSDAAGDGCDLARTLEESNMDVLKADDQDSHEIPSGHEDSPEVPPPRPFSMTNVIDSDFTTSNESIGVPKRNLFSCNESMFTPGTKEFLWQSEQSEVPPPEIHGVASGNAETVFSAVEHDEFGEMQNPEETPNGEAQIFETPPAEPNGEIIDGSNKKWYAGDQLTNQIVMNELTDVLKRVTPADDANDCDVTTACGTTASTSEGPKGTNEILSSGDSVVTTPDDLPRSEYSSSFTIPVPPPMPPPPRESEDVFGLPYLSNAHPQTSVDDFHSATDLRGTQVLYIRPPLARQCLGKKCVPQRSSVNRRENESDENQTAEAPSGRDSTPSKRNDMVTLAILAFAVGVGTLGYMTIAATGSNLFPEAIGVAGGRALNVIEKALQVLKSLNNRL